ncbi:A-agglutinin anchorage subunit-like [Zea mays]|uniref:A-agglutinin anchorage subunit-like n=1 Tax=Zea mays TaxID=4577 RepID=UPI001651E0C2|nr:A-agglutinin anchorage subunit-like [Zea mays]
MGRGQERTCQILQTRRWPSSTVVYNPIKPHLLLNRRRRQRSPASSPACSRRTSSSSSSASTPSAAPSDCPSTSSSSRTARRSPSRTATSPSSSRGRSSATSPTSTRTRGTGTCSARARWSGPPSSSGCRRRRRASTSPAPTWSTASPTCRPTCSSTAGAAAASRRRPGRRQKVEEMLQLFEKSRRQLGKLLDIYEQRLGEEAFLAGGKFTLADLSHLPNADRLAGDPRSARLMESRRNVSKWWDTVSRRDSWVRVKELQRPPSAEAPF